MIIPIYYNADTIEACYKDLKEKVLDKLESDEYEVVMVDDGSKDTSWNIMKKIEQSEKNISLVKLSRNFGSHAACLAGLSVCTGDCATIKAADLQEPSQLILDMFESWKQGNNVVLAVRADRKEGFSQKMFANLYYWLIKKMVLKNMPSGGFDCYLIDRKVIEVLKNLDENNSAITLQILWAGFKTDMVYYIREERKSGKSRWTFSKKIKLVVDSVVSFSFVPIRVISIIGVLFLIGSCVWIVFLILFKIFAGINVDGWTSLMILILFSSGLIMFTLGILGEYIWRTTDAARKRPVYIIDEKTTYENKEKLNKSEGKNEKK